MLALPGLSDEIITSSTSRLTGSPIVVSLASFDSIGFTISVFRCDSFPLNSATGRAPRSSSVGLESAVSAFRLTGSPSCVELAVSLSFFLLFVDSKLNFLHTSLFCRSAWKPFKKSSSNRISPRSRRCQNPLGALRDMA